MDAKPKERKQVLEFDAYGRERDPVDLRLERIKSPRRPIPPGEIKCDS